MPDPARIAWARASGGSATRTRAQTPVHASTITRVCASAATTGRPDTIKPIRTDAMLPVSSGRLSPSAAFYLQASITVSFLAGSAAPTPLYPVYQSEWGFSSSTVTLVFGIYALAVLIALLVAGRLSDHVGRRPVLLAAAAVQAATMLLFATATGTGSLLVARSIQGLSTGAALSAVGAGLLDLAKVRGAIANAIAPLLGTASGSIAAGLTVHYLPAPTRLIYGILALVFVAQGVGVVLMAETAAPRQGAWASLQPRFRLSTSVRTPMLLALPALVATWSLGGFYASLGPALVGGVLGFDASLMGGVALFVLAGSGAAAVLLLQRRGPRVMMSFGTAALASGVGIAILALSCHSAWGFFLGTALAGSGFGAGFQGAVRSVVPLASAQERAGVLSVIFVVSYLAMGLPAVVAGYFVAHQGNVFTTAREFGVAVMILAVVAMAGALMRRDEGTAATAVPAGKAPGKVGRPRTSSPSRPRSLHA